RDSLVEQAARIVTKVDDVALELRADGFLEIGDRSFKICRSLLVEARYVDIAYVTFGFVLDRFDADHVADHLHVEGIVHALTHDGEGDRRVDRAAHLL